MSETSEKINALGFRVSGLEFKFDKMQVSIDQDKEERQTIISDLKLLTAEMSTHNKLHVDSERKGYNNKVVWVMILAIFLTPLLTIGGTVYVNSQAEKAPIERSIQNDLPD